VLIGGREKREIVIAEYDEGWPGQFVLHQQRIAAALGDRAERIEHIGSTSVPGLAAKAIIDLGVRVASFDDPGVPADLVAAGYVWRVDEAEHLMFRTPALDVHLHLWRSDAELERHVLFRDWLRGNDDDRAAYEALKRELATREWADMNDYADAKGPLIAEIMARASQAG
jgi:GrpB-like predicted nucleotidyltransferase (UPF0157 family)